MIKFSDTNEEGDVGLWRRERRLLLYVLETKARRGDREHGRLYEGAEERNSRGTHGHSLH